MRHMEARPTMACRMLCWLGLACQWVATALEFEPVRVPTLTLPLLQEMKTSTHIHLIHVHSSGTVYDMAADENNIFTNRWHKYYGRASLVFCEADEQLCAALHRSLGHPLSYHGPKYVRYNGEGKFEAYQGIAHLHGVQEWLTRLPGGTEYLRHNHLFEVTGPLEPQMSDSEKEFLGTAVTDAPADAIFVEYGMGGSTYMVAGLLRETQIWHSIEHNRNWVDLVEAAIPQPADDAMVHLHHMMPHHPYPGPYDQEHLEIRVIGHYREEIPMGLDAFVFADTDPAIEWEGVHFVLVDGLARGAVLTIIGDRIRPGTIVMLHDYIGRESWYDWAIRQGKYKRIKVVQSALILEATKANFKDTPRNECENDEF